MVNEQIVEEASQWFVTLRHDTPDAATQERFVEWLRISPEHVRAYLGVITLWNDLPALDRQQLPGREMLIAAALAEGNVASFSATAGAAPLRTFSFVTRYRARIVAAAAAVLLVLVGAIAYQFNTAGVYAASVGEQRTLKLQDGSSVQLNSRSRIRVVYSDAVRRIDLIEGQALFHVAKDAQRPFLVRSGATSIRAIGTQFDVYRREAATVVTVVEGRIAVAPAPATDGQEISPAVLTAGEQLVVSTQAPTAAQRPVRADVTAVTAWTHGKLIFTSMLLSGVVDEFNRYNTRRLVLDESAPNIPITAVFSSTDSQMLVEFLKTQPEFDIQLHADEIRIRSAARK